MDKPESKTRIAPNKNALSELFRQGIFVLIEWQTALFSAIPLLLKLYEQGVFS